MFSDLAEKCYQQIQIPSKIYSICDPNYPYKTIDKETKEAMKPYITKEMTDLVKKKHKLRKLCNQFPMRYKDEYNALRNLVSKTIKRAKEQFYKTLSEENSSTSKGMWSTVNCILNGSVFSQRSKYCFHCR